MAHLAFSQIGPRNAEWNNLAKNVGSCFNLIIFFARSKIALVPAGGTDTRAKSSGSWLAPRFSLSTGGVRERERKRKDRMTMRRGRGRGGEDQIAIRVDRDKQVRFVGRQLKI